MLQYMDIYVYSKQWVSVDSSKLFQVPYRLKLFAVGLQEMHVHARKFWGYRCGNSSGSAY